ncbi:hypothetical protein RCL1_007134 [Eukaryota sp. TZLM3-RCL]
MPKEKPRTHIIYSCHESRAPREFSRELANRIGVPSFDPQEYDPSDLGASNDLILVVDGKTHAPPSDFMPLWDHLKDQHPDLSHLKYSIFSTGSSSKVGSNVFAKRLDEQLQRCKANRRLIYLGDTMSGDIQHQFEDFSTALIDQFEGRQRKDEDMF